MSNQNAEISAAIDAADIGKARLLLREALRMPDAETYYLASLVALSDEQQRDFLQRAIILDPFHPMATEALRTQGQTTCNMNSVMPLTPQIDNK